VVVVITVELNIAEVVRKLLVDMAQDLMELLVYSYVVVLSHITVQVAVPLVLAVVGMVEEPAKDKLETISVVAVDLVLLDTLTDPLVQF
jgi:hypothetical protein